jgi:hypothetical protein
MKVVNKIREDYKKQAETQKVYFKMEKIDTLTDRQLYLRHRMRVKQGQNKPEVNSYNTYTKYYLFFKSFTVALCPHGGGQ